ncbi:hypothetical protein M413DRAFT_73918 [Hebeloma cylindrosporum]|uniref:Zn(2)-C6 fungal-type domain-containing protein n=1 Tax=Hebeloma cylindrosporum TaxID=76867 RepID=A0A0C3BTT2_HEBCY|nr:hypothetical protein M413DRAFT_73918 [Hebeloma cylindrosporum h7]
MLPSNSRRRKKDRACDACRRRKIKCDGPWMLGNLCTNCLHTRKPCTYVETSKPRGPPKAYVTGLEDRLEALEALLEQIRPNTDFSDELGPPVKRGSWKSDSDPSKASSFKSANQKSLASTVLPPVLIPFEKHTHDPAKDTHVVSPTSRSTHLSFRPRPRPKRSRTDFDATLSSSEEDYSTGTSSSSSDTDEMVITSLKGRERIGLRASEADDAQEYNNIRFHGRSSTAGLVETTRQFKHLHMRETLSPTQLESTIPISPDNKTVAQTRRPEFWRTPHWELKYEGARTDSNEVLEGFLQYFPPPNVAETLIDLYFLHSNIIFPLLHRPTFTRQWKQGLHRRNIWFACVCALIFAVASRWCEDERVLPTGDTKEVDWKLAGGRYFEIGVEIHRVRRNLLHPASLFEVQTFTLIGMYLRGSSALPTAWLAISAGMRKAMDVGAHRKRVYGTKPSINDELWKRAFWHLVVFDRLGGASLGRPCGITEEDFDLELPLEVDDDYWEAGDPFKQPPDLPSLITAFNQFIKLTQIMAFTLRTLYALDKSKIFRGMVPIERDNIVKNLSVALADWLKNVPEHLRWSNNMTDQVYSSQSSTLFSTFYLTQMLVYRPLIPSAYPAPPAEPTSPQDCSLIQPAFDPAIVICMEAAKSCANMVEFQLHQGLRHYHPPNIINVSYLCAGIFLLVGWNLKVQEKDFRNKGTQDLKPPLAQRIEENIAQAKIFIRALEALKPRWEVVDSML